MKKMKKLLVLCVAVLTLALSLFTGCKSASPASASATSSKPVKLTVAWWGTQVRNDRQQAVFDQYTKENPNVTFDGQAYAFADYYSKLATDSAAKNLPDIYQISAGTMTDYMSKNLMYNMTPYTKNGIINISKINPSMIDAGSMNGKLFVMPLGINNEALVYNKTLLDNNGITVKDNMNINDFMALSENVYEKTGYKTDLVDGYDNMFTYLSRTNGKYIFDKAGKLDVSSATQPEMSQYFQICETGVKEGWALDMGVFTSITYGAIEQMPLVLGKSPNRMSWCALLASNQLTTAQAAAPKGTELAITLPPSDNQKNSNFLNFGTGFAIAPYCKNPVEAAKFINYMTNSVEANNILLAERGIPVSSDVANAIAPKLDPATKLVSDYLTNVASKNCSLVGPAQVTGTTQVLSLFKQFQEQVLYGKLTASQAAQELFDQGNKLMASAQ
jgi:multiple sugar transport system substrate-binding protein